MRSISHYKKEYISKTIFLSVQRAYDWRSNLWHIFVPTQVEL